MFVGVVWTVAKVTVPLLIQRAIDRGIRGDDSLTMWGLAIAGAGLVSAVATGARRYIAFQNARAVEADLRDRVYEHALRLQFAYHDTHQTGQLMSRGNTDLQQFQNFVGRFAQAHHQP